MLARPAVPPVFVVNAALRLRRLLQRAADAVVPPHVVLTERMLGAPVTMLLHSAAELRIADMLAGGPLSAEEIAARTGTSADAIGRALGLLAALGIFRRDRGGRFANNRLSAALTTANVTSSRGFADFFGLGAVMAAWADLPATLRTGESAFRRVHGRSLWDWLGSDEGAGAIFGEAMGAMTELVAPAVAAKYPFGEVQRVCDVGGGIGIVLGAVLSGHSHLRGVLFDSAGTLERARARLSAAGVADRVELVPGSFFDSVPRGCDAYLMKTVLHNWDDERALRILRNCRAAMDPGHRVLAVEFVHAPDAPSVVVPLLDILNMVCFEDGRERTVAEMERLFDQAGFRLDRVIPIPGGQAILEGIARAE